WQPSSLNSQSRQPSGPISSIHIGKRHRKDMGDIDALARRMADCLLQPIVIRPDDRLIAGHRRLVATPLLATTVTRQAGRVRRPRRELSSERRRLAVTLYWRNCYDE